jgi:anti-sigma28 factor (negative regulator of flagellin synthesis)
MTAPEQNSPITMNAVVVASGEFVSSDLAGETIVLSLQNAMYYGLDQVAARIWALVREPIRVEDIRDAIRREYDVDEDRCARDVLAFLHELAGNGLIEVKDGAGA